MGLFSAIGGLFGGGKAKKASRNAEAAQLEYLTKALTEQQRQFDITRADYAPLTALLGPSVKGLGDLIGVNGNDAWEAALTRVQDSPTLARIIEEGTDGILANASATGGLRGGNVQRGLADFRGDAFINELAAEQARLAGLVGLGSGATDAVSSFGARKADNISNIFGQQGQVRAGGILTRGGINNQMWQNAGSGLDSLVAAFMPGGGGLKGLF